MADACSVASYRKLAWTAGWHLREETYRQALAMLVNAQQRQPLAAVFGAADVSSSDGQAFPDRRTRRGRGRHQCRTTGARRRRCSTRIVSARHAPVPHRRHPALGRGGPRHRRAALSRGGPQHCRPSHRRRRRQRSRLCLGASAGLPFRAAHPQPRRAPALCLRTGLDLAGAGAVHRRAPGRKADHRALGRRAAPDCFRADRHRQRLAHAQAPRRLSAAERLGTRAARDRPHRTHAATPWTGWNSPRCDGRRRRNSTRAKAATRWPAPCASTASVVCATARPKRSNTAQAAWPSSPRPSCCGTPSISAVP